MNLSLIGYFLGNNILEFEKKLNEFIKVRVYDDSQKLSLPNNSIFLLIQATWQSNLFQKIGIATAWVWSKKRIEWMDIKIDNPNHRGKGIGSLVVDFLCSYLKENGANEIFGHISNVDDVKKAKNFWEKNGFTVTYLKEPKGPNVAEVELRFGKSGE